MSNENRFFRKSNAMSVKLNILVLFCSGFDVFYISANQGVVEQVAEELVADAGEVDLVFLCQSGFLPVLHRTQSAHDVELVPHGGIVLFSHLHEGFFSDDAIGIDLVTCLFPIAFQPLVAVIIGHEEQGAIRVDALDDFDKLVIVALKDSFVDRKEIDELYKWIKEDIPDNESHLKLQRFQPEIIRLMKGLRDFEQHKESYHDSQSFLKALKESVTTEIRKKIVSEKEK